MVKIVNGSTATTHQYEAQALTESKSSARDASSNLSNPSKTKDSREGASGLNNHSYTPSRCDSREQEGQFPEWGYYSDENHENTQG